MKQGRELDRLLKNTKNPQRSLWVWRHKVGVGWNVILRADADPKHYFWPAFTGDEIGVLLPHQIACQGLPSSGLLMTKTENGFLHSYDNHIKHFSKHAVHGKTEILITLLKEELVCGADLSFPIDRNDSKSVGLKGDSKGGVVGFL
jgi:hypothetical protein